MDPVLMASEMANGSLPWFKALRDRDRYRSLDCGPVPYEPSNLATAFSGVNPGVHGCFSYWSAHSGGEIPRILDASDVRASRLWEWDEMKGVRVSVVNVQLTHPPAPVNGTLISYPMNNSMNTTYPRRLLSDLQRQGVRYAHDVSLFYTGQPFEEFAKDAFRIAAAQLDTAMALAPDADVMIVNLTLPDRLSHFLWYELDAAEQRARPHILQAYDFVDDACRRLETLGAESMLVFSEIGFGKLDGFFSIDRYLQQEGLQFLDENGQVDLQRSVAMETAQGSHGVMLCADLGGTGQATQASIDQVREFLLQIRFDDGQPALAEVRHRDELYRGPFTHLGPTLVVRPADEKRPPLGDPRWAKHVRRTSQSGWHRDQGFIALAGGPSLRPHSGSVELQQIAPTIAQLAGREPARQCEMGGFLQ
jgi:predicted AlkP superfamily phosphohydrolase/phosphomutase